MLYAEINIFCLFVLLIIYLNIHRRINRYLIDQKVFLAILYTDAILLIVDAVMWLVDGAPGDSIRIVYSCVTVIYYTLNPLICALWFLYTVQYISKVRLSRIVVPVMFPVVLILILSLASLTGNVLFFIDADNVYHRGRYFLVMALISVAYLLFTAGYTIVTRRKLQRKEFLTLLFFPIPPIIGGVVQTLRYGTSLIWACVTLSLLIIFVNFQNDELSTDHLTGLYNRRLLDEYLRTISISPSGRPIAGLMIDLNSFKVINDTFGHSSGDQALIHVAGILNKTFRKSDFIARYGGDEFVVIMEINNMTDLEKAVKRLNENVALFNDRKLIPFEISLSIGYDYFPADAKNAADFLKHIDSLMYSDKQKTKNPENTVVIGRIK